MRALALAIIVLVLAADAAEARRAQRMCLFFCPQPAARQHHARRHRHRGELPPPSAAVPDPVYVQSCKEINEAVAGLGGRNGDKVKEIRGTMTPRQIAVMDQCESR